MKKLVVFVFALLAIASAASAGPLLPVRVGPDGNFHAVREIPRPPTLVDWLRGALEPPDAFAGFDLPVIVQGAVGYDNTICASTGLYGGVSVPRCTNGDGTFYIPFAMPAIPASPPSFTVSFDVQNQGGETTSGNGWCYRASCAVITAASANADTITGLTYGTVSSNAANTFSGCNVAKKACVGAATGSFTCTDNGTAAGCSGTACNDHFTAIKVEVRKTGCTSATLLAIDYGMVRMIEAN